MIRRAFPRSGPSAFVAVLAASALSGCGGAPAVRHPELPADLPPGFAAADAPPTAPGAPALSEADRSESDRAVASWWVSFPDPELQSLVATALDSNLDLARASARLEAAAAEARIAGAGVWPQVSAAGSAARREQVFVGLPIPTASGGPLSSTTNSYGVSVDVSWELDVWGRARAARSAGGAEFEAAFADREGARLSLAAQTIKAALAVREAERQAALAAETAESHRATERRIRSRYLEGVRPAIDLRLAVADRASAEAVLSQRRAALEATRRALELLLGRYPSGTLEVAAELGPPPPPVPSGLPADLLRRRPDLVAAERRFAAAGRRTWEAKASLLPRISLTGSGGRTSDQLEDLLDGDFTVWGLAANLFQPVLQGGRLRAGVSRAAAVEEAALAEWASLVLRACAEAEGALAAERHLATQEEALAIAAEQAAAARDLALSRYESGLADVITLLSAQRTAASAESRRLEARRRRLEARVDLHLALGGGFTLPETAAASPAPGS